MKRAIVLLVLSLSVSMYSRAQGCLFDRSVDTLGYAAPFASSAWSNGWLIGGNMGDQATVYLMQVDCNGQHSWLNVPVAVEGSITDIVPNGNRIYATGLFYQVTDFPTSAGLFVLVYDSSQNLLDWHVYFSDSVAIFEVPIDSSHYTASQNWAGYHPTYNNSIYRGSQLAIIDSNKLMLSMGNHIASINVNDWSVDWSKQLNGIVMDISRPINNHYYVATQSRLYWVDENGDSIRSAPQIIDSRQIYHAGNGKDYVTADSSILEVDTLLHVLQQYPLQANYNSWNGLSGANNQVYISGQKTVDDSIVVLVLDSVLNLTNTFTVKRVCETPVSLSASNSLILVVGNSETTYFRTYTPNGQSDLSNSKIELTSFNINSVNYNYINRYDFGGGNFAFDYSAVINGDFVVTNIGNDTIRDFYIRDGFALMFPYGYSAGWYRHYYTTIPPVASKHFYDYSTEISGTTNNNVSAEIAATIMIGSVNGAIPDAACGANIYEARDTLLLGISEAQLLADSKIYPNPANSQITIQLGNAPTPNATFTLTDLSGRALLQQPLTRQQQNIDISQLSQGIYVYSITYSDGRQLKGKICKL